MSRKTIVIIGGALSGPTAAARAREVDEQARIVMVERNRRVSYAVCGLAYHLSGEVARLEDLDQERAKFFESVYNIEVWTDSEVTALDPAKQTVMVTRADRSEALAYDALIVALGAASRLPQNLPAGAQPGNLVCFRTIDDLETIQRQTRGGGKRITILGGGPMGMEAADGLVRHGADVTVIEKQSRLLGSFSSIFSDAALHALRSKAKVFLSTDVSGFEMAGNRISSLKLSDGSRLETDLVISTIGLRPRTSLLQTAGSKLAPDQTVIIDDHARTSLPNVYACGVCVSTPQAVTGRAVWYPQGALADKTAQVAGANAAGADRKLSPALGSMLIRALDVTVGRTGLTRAEASTCFGQDEVAVTAVSAPTHESYFPASAPLLLEMIWRRSDGRILGVEAAGVAGVDKRIDVAAGLIAGSIDIERLAVLDFGFEPPYSAARDPLNVAATVASSERSGLARSIEPDELIRCLRDVQVIDVRPNGVKGRASIQGAVRIPLEQLRGHMKSLDRKRSIVTVSESGRRGMQAARILAQCGFGNVVNLAGGLQVWALRTEAR